VAKVIFSDLASELGLTNRELMDVAYELGIVAEDHTAELSDAEAALIRQHLKPHRRIKAESVEEEKGQPLRIVKVRKGEERDEVLLEERELGEEGEEEEETGEEAEKEAVKPKRAKPKKKKGKAAVKEAEEEVLEEKAEEEEPVAAKPKGPVVRKATPDELRRLQESLDAGKPKPKGKAKAKPKTVSAPSKAKVSKPAKEKEKPEKAEKKPESEVAVSEEEVRVRRPAAREDKKSWLQEVEAGKKERAASRRTRLKLTIQEDETVPRADRLRGGLKGLEEEIEQPARRRRRRRKKRKPAGDTWAKPVKPKRKGEVSKTQLKKKRAREREKIRMLDLRDGLTVAEFAGLIKEHPETILEKSRGIGEVVENIASILSAEAMLSLASDMGFEVSYDESAESAEVGLQSRPPVITMLGHVDHGKTSLLDVIRKTKVTESEAGGITQHIGASVVDYDGNRLVFLDTPGHEAFTAMRARGAQATDIVVLVVAADDGVMPQTIEAINHAKAAGVSIIVAINKIDKAGINPEAIKQELSKLGLSPEDWGGDTFFAQTSAITGEGIDTLLDMVVLASDMLDLKANPNRRACGVALEAELDRSKGHVANVLVTDGTLRVGDHFILGTSYGKVRIMYDHLGKTVKEAIPSTPVKVLGLSTVPQAGDTLVALDEDLAKELAEQLSIEKHVTQVPTDRISLDDWFAQLAEGKANELNLIIKSDVYGTAEALSDSIKNLGNEEARSKVIHTGVGNVNESDVLLASTSGAVIIAFDVGIDSRAKATAEVKGVDVRFYEIIYEVLEDIRAALEGLLAPEIREVELGKAEVRQLFSIPRGGVVAGCMVTEGKVQRGCKANVYRDGEVIFEGKVESLRRFKENVKEVASGFECGVVIAGFNDAQEGDVLEFIGEELVSRRLE